MSHFQEQRDDQPVEGAEAGQRQQAEVPPVVAEPLQVRLKSLDERSSVTDSWYEHVDPLRQWLHAKAYGAPRVFDLFTGLAVTLAWAVLFALLRLLQPLFDEALPTVALVISWYLLAIALCQAIFFGGKKPRLASLVGGPLVWLVTSVAMMSVSSLWGAPMTIDRLIRMVIASFCFAPLGMFTGYLAGGLVAGVFLLADKLRSLYGSFHPPAASGDEDALWGEVPPRHVGSNSSSQGQKNNDG
ncbi:MAG: hypothetical protein KatS3mg111_0498 [Pirellulaceae bacterium]|nr:MAG: hypothetical protein KatS3mg111_0498 [Pirellulaceae bacterium]